LEKLRKEVMFKPIKRRKQSEEVLFRLQNLIVSGDLRAGEKLPPEQELADFFQVNRASVREALQALETLRFLNIRQGDGTYLRDDWYKTGSIEFLAIWVGLGGRLGEKTLKDTLELRRCIDIFSATLACQRAKPEHISEMEAAIKQGEQTLQEGHSGERGDREFHLALAKSTGNDQLVKLTYTIHLIWGDVSGKLLSNREFLSHSLQQHKEVLDRIKKGDAEGARQAMERHVSHAEAGILAIVRKEAGEGMV